MKLPETRAYPFDTSKMTAQGMVDYFKQLLMEHKKCYEDIARIVNLNSQYLGDYTGGNYMGIESDGTIVFKGNATTYNDVLALAVTVGPGASAPSYTAFNGNLNGYEFLGSGVTTKDLIMGFQLPHTYQEGSSIDPHIHVYIPNDGTGGDIRFGLEYTWVNVDGTEPATTSIYKIVTIAAGAGNLGNYKISFGDIVGTGKKISSVFYSRLFRNPAAVTDTFGSSVWLKSADIHIMQDTVGSRSEYIK